MQHNIAKTPYLRLVAHLATHGGYILLLDTAVWHHFAYYGQQTLLNSLFHDYYCRLPFDSSSSSNKPYCGTHNIIPEWVHRLHRAIMAVGSIISFFCHTVFVIA